MGIHEKYVMLIISATGALLLANTWFFMDKAIVKQEMNADTHRGSGPPPQIVPSNISKEIEQREEGRMKRRSHAKKAIQTIRNAIGMLIPWIFAITVGTSVIVALKEFKRIAERSTGSGPPPAIRSGEPRQ